MRYLDGDEERLGLEQVGDYVSEDNNPGNRRRVESVDLLVADLPWPAAVVFVDTPGTGSVEQQHDQVAASAAGAMDVALVVLTSDPPISARERHQLSVAAAQSAEIVLVLAKSDLLTEPELEAVTTYTRTVVVEVVGRDVEMIPVSTRNARIQPHPGLSRVRDLVVSLATDPERQTLDRSIRRRARRLVRAELDELSVSLSLADMDIAEVSGRAGAFRRALKETRARNRDCAGLVHAAVRSINSELDASLQSAKADLTKELLDAPELTIDRLDKRRSESAAIDSLTTRATESAESWRRRSSSRVEKDLTEVSQRATFLMSSAISQLRDVARDELGVELVVDCEPISLPADAGFFYLQTSLTDAASAITGAVRDRLPRGIRRRTVSAYLKQNATMLADRQLGRARGDLRQRLGRRRADAAAPGRDGHQGTPRPVGTRHRHSGHRGPSTGRHTARAGPRSGRALRRPCQVDARFGRPFRGGAVTGLLAAQSW